MSNMKELLNTDKDNKGGKDSLYQDVLALCEKEKNYTTLFIQKHFSIGYSRAVAILDNIKKELE